MTAKTEKALVMVFKNHDGDNTSMTLNNIKPGITNTEVKSAMDLIITNNIFKTSGGDLTSKVSARIIDKVTTPHEFK